MLATIFTIALIGLISLALSAWLAQPDAPIRILDQPNERSLHATPTPRTGGIAICVSLATGWLVYAVLTRDAAIPAQVLTGALIVAGISMLDDRFGLTQAPRLLVQIVAVLIFMQGGFVTQGDLLPGLDAGHAWIAATITFIITLWLINLFNFMDGMDGFAGGMTVIGFGTLAVLGYGQEDTQFAGAALAVAAAAASFLWFNFPPAQIFMGDSGSTTLGFLVAAFAVWGSRRGVAPVWLTLVVFSPFVVDATVTLIRRVLRGEPIWRPHRSHYYQRLVQLGWSHRRTVLVEYFVMLICAVTALSLVESGMITQWTVLAVLVFGYLGAALAIHRMERRR